MARNNQRGSKSNNPEGKNQYSSSYGDIARERPLATALGTAAAVGAGVFLWSRRNQISEQLSNLSEQISEWSESRGWSRGEMFDASRETAGETFVAGSGSNFNSTAATPRRTRSKTQQQIAEEALTLKETGAEA